MSRPIHHNRWADEGSNPNAMRIRRSIAGPPYARTWTPRVSARLHAAAMAASSRILL